VTAEYAMLPRSTHTRSGRNPGGRGQEIQRLIGRALRTSVRLGALGTRQITVDCDVIQADGGTRTAAITGGWVALALAIRRLAAREKLTGDPIRLGVAAVSTGIVSGEPRLDLAYAEDSAADVDFNFVLTDTGKFVEIQGTAESEPFSGEEYGRLVDLAKIGAQQLFALQRDALARAKTP
jgi:ribonuclease PH